MVELDLIQKGNFAMRVVRAFVVLVLFSIAAGCAYGPTQEQLNTADFGYEPDQAQSENLAKEFFETRLKDPDSARYQFTPVYKGWLYSDRLEGCKLYAGYVLDVAVNSKNSYGGYAGWSSYRFILHDGYIIRAVSVSPQGVFRTLY